MGKQAKRIRTANIKSQSTPISAMVPMPGILSKREVRDLIEFLASHK